MATLLLLALIALHSTATALHSTTTVSSTTTIANCFSIIAPLHLHDYLANSALETVVIQVRLNEVCMHLQSRLQVTAVFDDSFTLTSPFDGSGEATILSDGVFWGSHIVHAVLLLDGEPVEGTTPPSVCFDLTPTALLFPPTGVVGPAPPPECNNSTHRPSRGGSPLSIAYLDALPAFAIDGQRTLWLDQMNYLSPFNDVHVLLLGEWPLAPESRWVGGDVKRVKFPPPLV